MMAAVVALKETVTRAFAQAQMIEEMPTAVMMAGTSTSTNITTPGTIA